MKLEYLENRIFRNFRRTKRLLAFFANFFFRVSNGYVIALRR